MCVSSPITLSYVNKEPAPPKPTRHHKETTLPPPEWELSTIMESQEEDDDDAPLTELQQPKSSRRAQAPLKRVKDKPGRAHAQENATTNSDQGNDAAIVEHTARLVLEPPHPPAKVATHNSRKGRKRKQTVDEAATETERSKRRKTRPDIETDTESTAKAAPKTSVREPGQEIPQDVSDRAKSKESLKKSSQRDTGSGDGQDAVSGD